MKQNIFIAALLAGMLVLAGCGGGSSSSGGGDTGGGTPTATAVKLPSGSLPGSVALEDDGDKREITIKASDSLASRTIGGVVYTCPAGECVATFENLLGKLVVTSTGGLTAAAPTPPAPTGAGTTADTGPQSNASIMAAIEGDGTIYGLGFANNVLSENNADTGSVFLDDNKRIVLHLQAIQSATLVDTVTTNDVTAGADALGDNYIFWGLWGENTVGSANPVAYTRIWGGSMPYGEKPERITSRGPTYGASATYAGTGTARLFRRIGSSGPWNVLTGDPNLTANFVDSTIMGTIQFEAAELLGTGGADLDITLKKTTFSSDTFSGSAEFSGDGVTTTRPKGNGSYNGAFFGPTADRDGTNNVREQYPSLVAGQFSVTSGSGATVLNAHGTFGTNRATVPALTTP